MLIIRHQAADRSVFTSKSDLIDAHKCLCHFWPVLAPVISQQPRAEVYCLRQFQNYIHFPFSADISLYPPDVFLYCHLKQPYRGASPLYWKAPLKRCCTVTLSHRADPVSSVMEAHRTPQFLFPGPKAEHEAPGTLYIEVRLLATVGWFFLVAAPATKTKTPKYS